MYEKVNITINGETNSYPTGISILELSKYFQDKMPNPIIAAKINNSVVAMSDRIKQNCELKFIDVNDINGQSMYLAALKYILIVAVKELYGETSEIYYLNSLDKGLYTELKINTPLTEQEITKITEKMQEIIDLDLPFEKVILHKKDAVNYLTSQGELEKARNIQSLSNSTAVFFKLKHHFNYFYVDMPTSTKIINHFNLKLVSENTLVLRFPTARSNNEIPDYNERNKTLECFTRYRNWLQKLNINYVADLNIITSQNKIKEFMQLNKIFLDDQLLTMAREIGNKKGEIKIVLVAGPSSAGKTTSSHRLALYLKTQGLHPILISADDYFKEREDSPKNELGEYDYECPDALDMKLFNDHLQKMLKGESVSIPKFNFYTGKKEYKGRIIKLEEDDILIIEGLHCINEIMTSSIPKAQKYKVYISPFMALRMDKHNHISTTDIRLLRRIIRDSVYRGYSVSDTIANWQKVRAGEEKYVFPYQNEADYIFNTASAYELGVLKVFAEPLLYSVPVDSPYYEEARRLLGYLRIYFPITSEYVANDSVLREFIGGSVFDPH